jgi:cytosine/adenosine deaminase-related metal-dependent hydrolase
LDTIGRVGEKIAGQILLVHNTFTNEKSLDEAIARIENLYLAICPLSNLFIHRALPPINLFREKEVKITLGTDSLSSNTILSMADEILAIHRYFPAIPLEEILVWATINGAKFLKKEDDLGTFELGKRPGVVLIDNIDWQNRRLTDKSKSVRLV